MTSVKDKLEGQLGPIFFSDLRAHLDRGAVFLVRGELALIDCALAVATDDTAQVRTWLSNGAMRRPTDEERAQWASEASRRFLAVPVQPYVLIQEEESPS